MESDYKFTIFKEKGAQEEIWAENEG